MRTALIVGEDCSEIELLNSLLEPNFSVQTAPLLDTPALEARVDDFPSHIVLHNIGGKDVTSDEAEALSSVVQAQNIQTTYWSINGKLFVGRLLASSKKNGNSHEVWRKICSPFGFLRYIGIDVERTNVAPEELNYHNYDMEQYDRDIINSIPGHDELHKHLEELVRRELANDSKILELGIGTALTAQRILKIFPDARYIGNDFDPQRIEDSKERLCNYAVTFIEGDYAELDLPQDNNAVVSVIGIHHQGSNYAKRRLFQKIYDSLSPEGIFIFGDLVTYRDEVEAARNDALHYHHLVAHAASDEALKEWAHHHKFLNALAPLEDQVEWLEQVGFREVEVLYKKFNTALVHAKK